MQQDRGSILELEHPPVMPISEIPIVLGPHHLLVIVYYILIKYISLVWYEQESLDLVKVAAYLDKNKSLD